MDTPTITIDRAEYDRLKAIEAEAEAREDRIDAAIADKVLADIAAGREELLTDAELDELLAAPSPMQFWRKRRGLTQVQLAAAAGLSQPRISEIEGGGEGTTVAVMKRIADALRVTIDDLV